MKNKDEYLTLGEVAEKLGINKTTLRHYNREGLITSERDENNYRYYNKNQLNGFRVILILRKLGFSIKKIKEINEYINQKKYDLIIKMVKERITECYEEIEKINGNVKVLGNHEKYLGYLTDIIRIDPEYIYFNPETQELIKKENEIFAIKSFEEEEFAVLYAGTKISDREAVEKLYQKIEENNYKTTGDLSIENIRAFDGMSKEKIKIFKIPIKPLTCQQMTGLE